MYYNSYMLLLSIIAELDVSIKINVIKKKDSYEWNIEV